MDNISIELLRKNMDTVILRSLYDGSKYGLEIYNDIKNSSQELYMLKQATMYKTLKKMEEDGLIISSPGEESNGAKRVYLSLTSTGRERIEQTMKEWEFSRTILDKLVSNRVFNPDEQDAPFDVSKLRPKTKRTTRRDSDDSDNISAISSEDAVNNTASQSNIDTLIGNNVDSDCVYNDFNAAVSDKMASNDTAFNSFPCENTSPGNAITDTVVHQSSNESPATSLLNTHSNSSENEKSHENYTSIFKQIDDEQRKINLDDRFAFSTEIKSDLITNAHSDTPQAQPIASNSIPTSPNIDDSQNSALYTLYSNNYEAPKESFYTPPKSSSTHQSTPYSTVDNNSQYIQASKSRNNEDVNAAALKLYDKTYNPTAAPSASYLAPIISASKSGDKNRGDLTHYNTEIRAKDPLSINEKRRIYDSFMSDNNSKPQQGNSTPSNEHPSFEEMQHDIMTATIETNRAKQTTTREKASTVFNHSSFDIQPVETVVKKSVNETKKQDNPSGSVNYINSFDNIYKASAIEQPQVKEINNIAAVQDYSEQIEYEDMSFSKLKTKLASEDIKLKQYVKSNTATYYVGRFYYSTRIIRDLSLIMYAIFFVFALAMHFITNSVVGSASVGGIISVILVGAAMPASAILLWINDRNKRKRTSFNMIQSVISCTIVIMISLLVIFLVAFLGFKINISDVKTYFAPLIVPIISLLLFPLSLLVYTLLYNSKNYHVK